MQIEQKIVYDEGINFLYIKSFSIIHIIGKLKQFIMFVEKKTEKNMLSMLPYFLSM